MDQLDNFEYQRAVTAADFIRKAIGGFKPAVAVVLGSGLGRYAESKYIDTRFSVKYSEIPDFPVSTVSGHDGCFVFGFVRGVPVVLMKGRVHLYEGYSPADTVLPIRVLKLLGAEVLILTNAAGGIHPGLNPGDFMLISDHISNFVPSPLRGKNIEEFGTRFTDMTEVYTRKMIEIAENSAYALGIQLKKGIYLQTQGPQYETPAEIRMMSLLGADAVGMSTVGEAIAAHHMGLQLCGISCITNKAAGLGQNALSHEEVKKTANLAEGQFQKLITEIISEVAQS